MFDISWGELVLIGMVALIVIGPKELPTVLRTAGQWMTKVRRMASEFQGQFHEAMREAEFADLKKQVESIGDPTRGIGDFNPLDTAQKEIESAFADKAAATPSGETAPPAANESEPHASPSGETMSDPPGVAASAENPIADEPAAVTPTKPSDVEGGRAA